MLLFREKNETMKIGHLSLNNKKKIHWIKSVTLFKFNTQNTKIIIKIGENDILPVLADFAWNFEGSLQIKSNISFSNLKNLHIENVKNSFKIENPLKIKFLKQTIKIIIISWIYILFDLTHKNKKYTAKIYRSIFYEGKM